MIRIDIDRVTYESILVASKPAGEVAGIPIRVTEVVPAGVVCLITPTEVVAVICRLE